MLEIILIILMVRISSNFKDAGQSGASRYIVPTLACMLVADVLLLIGRSSESLLLMGLGALCYIPALIVAIRGLNKSKALIVEANSSSGYSAPSSIRAVGSQTSDPLPAKIRALVDAAEPARLNKVIRTQSCPVCGSGADQIRPLGAKGARGTGAAVTIAFGAAGNLIAQQNSASKMTSMPIEYKCNSCKSKFQVFSEYATPEELLQRPAVIALTRSSGMLGAAVERFVLLNGIKVARVKNNRDVAFQTNVRVNELLVLDQYDATADASPLRFVVADGEIVQVFWNGKASRITRRYPAEQPTNGAVAAGADEDPFQTVSAERLFRNVPAAAVAMPVAAVAFAAPEPSFSAPEPAFITPDPSITAPEPASITPEPEPVSIKPEPEPAPEPVPAVPEPSAFAAEPEKESIPAILESAPPVSEPTLAAAPASLDAPTQPLPETHAKKAMPGYGFCFRCGAPLKSEAKFCHACGATVKRGVRPEA